MLILSRPFRLCWSWTSIWRPCWAQLGMNDIAFNISTWINLIQRSIRLPIVSVKFSVCTAACGATRRSLEADRVLDLCNHDLIWTPSKFCFAYSLWRFMASLACALQMRLLMLLITNKLSDNTLWDPLTTLSLLLSSVLFHNSLRKNFIYKPSSSLISDEKEICLLRFRKLFSFGCNSFNALFN